MSGPGGARSPAARFEILMFAQYALLHESHRLLIEAKRRAVETGKTSTARFEEALCVRGQ